MDFVSFTPGFSPVIDERHSHEKPLKRFLNKCKRLSTGLKPGVNERDF